MREVSEPSYLAPQCCASVGRSEVDPSVKRGIKRSFETVGVEQVQVVQCSKQAPLFDCNLEGSELHVIGQIGLEKDQHPRSESLSVRAG